MYCLQAKFWRGAYTAYGIQKGAVHYLKPALEREVRVQVGSPHPIRQQGSAPMSILNTGFSTAVRSVPILWNATSSQRSLSMTSCASGAVAR